MQRRKGGLWIRKSFCKELFFKIWRMSTCWLNREVTLRRCSAADLEVQGWKGRQGISRSCGTSVIMLLHSFITPSVSPGDEGKPIHFLWNKKLFPRSAGGFWCFVSWIITYSRLVTGLSNNIPEVISGC